METQRRNFASNHKIYLACAKKDELRPNTEFVFFQDGYAYATNAHILVRSKISEISDFDSDEIELLNGKQIHNKLFAQLIQNNWVEIDDRGFVSSDDGNVVIYQLRDDIKPYNWLAVLDGDVKKEAISRVGLSAKLLETLARAMGVSEGIELNFSTQNGRIIVHQKGCGTPDVTGLIMPIITDEPELQFPDNSNDTTKIIIDEIEKEIDDENN